MGGVPASADVFRAVADPTRRAMLDRLRGGECDVGDLSAPFGLAAPSISQHLRVLLDADLVRVRKSGRYRLYQLNAGSMRPLVEWAEHFRDVTDPEGHVWRLAEPSRAPGASPDRDVSYPDRLEPQESPHGHSRRSQPKSPDHAPPRRTRRPRRG